MKKVTVLSAVATVLFSAATVMATPFFSADGGATSFTSGIFALVPGDEVHLGVYDATPPVNLYRLGYIEVYLYGSVAPGDNINDVTVGASFGPPLFTSVAPDDVVLVGLNYTGPTSLPLNLINFDVDLTTVGTRGLGLIGDYVIRNPRTGRLTTSQFDVDATLGVPTPEPNTLILLGTGFVLFFFVGKRISKRSVV